MCIQSGNLIRGFRRHAERLGEMVGLLAPDLLGYAGDGRGDVVEQLRLLRCIHQAEQRASLAVIAIVDTMVITVRCAIDRQRRIAGTVVLRDSPKRFGSWFGRPPRLPSGPVVAKFPAGAAGTVQRILKNPMTVYVNVHNPEFPNGAIRGQLQDNSWILKIRSAATNHSWSVITGARSGMEQIHAG